MKLILKLLSFFLRFRPNYILTSKDISWQLMYSYKWTLWLICALFCFWNQYSSHSRTRECQKSYVHIQLLFINGRPWFYDVAISSQSSDASLWCHYVLIICSGSSWLCEFPPREVVFHLARSKYIRIKDAHCLSFSEKAIVPHILKLHCHTLVKLWSYHTILKKTPHSNTFNIYRFTICF